MSQLSSIFYYFLALAMLMLLGFGPSVSLLGKKLRAYALLIAPGVGYAVFCLISIWLSSLIGMPTVKANLMTGGVLLGWSGAAFWLHKAEMPAVFSAWRIPPAFAVVSGLVLFIPVFHLGIDGYLGTVNPDFFQSLSLHETLLRTNTSIWVSRHDLDLAGPFQQMFPDALQARFGGVTFSVLLEQLLGIPSQAAVLLAVMVFLSCLPLAVYFFARAVLEFEERAALLAAVLVVVAAPTGMSFLHTFIGQNSALAMFPLGITLIYLALREKSFGLILLAVLILNGVFFLYVMALPYIIAPFFLFLVGLGIRQEWGSIKFGVVGILVGALLTVGIHLTIYQTTSHFLRDLFDLLGKLTQSQYYADFLTEEVLQYATGLSSYPLIQNEFFISVYQWAPTILISIGGVIAALYFVMLKRWASKVSERAVIAVSAMLLTYLIVWFKYTFLTKYGYASFKMSAWLQFFFVCFVAWGIFDSFEKIRLRTDGIWERRFSYFSLIVLAGIFPFLNLLSNLDYARKSYGHDIYHGSIINSYGISGNSDYAAIEKNLRERVPEGKMVALGFGDSIENFWVSYYLDHIRLNAAILSHEEIPFEDAHLPDIKSRHYTDSMGNDQVDLRKFYKDAHANADYYLLPGKGNMNREVIEKAFNGVPVWENDSLRLFKKDQLNDVLVTGRGFYRVEHMATEKLPYWWPETFRWSAQGGEIYQFHPKRPGQPHRVQFSAIAGLGQLTGERTIELWHNGMLFDEVKVRGAARIISKPYLPVADINLIVLKIKEKSVLVGRNTGLWNRDLPRRATPINALFSHIRIQPEAEAGANVEGVPVSQWIPSKSLFYLYSRFNGFDVDGWVRDRAEFSFSPVEGINSLTVRVLIPGNLGFKFPSQVKFIVNGQSTIKTFENAGEFEVDLPMGISNYFDEINVQLIPEQAKHLNDGMVRRELFQSIRLSAIKLTK